jgi:hypothetical protein
MRRPTKKEYEALALRAKAAAKELRRRRRSKKERKCQNLELIEMLKK